MQKWPRCWKSLSGFRRHKYWATFRQRSCQALLLTRKVCSETDHGHANTGNQINAKFVEVFKATTDYWIFMDSSLISYSGLHNSSFRTKLAMDNSSSYEEKKCSNNAWKDPVETNSANVLTRRSLFETKSKRTDFGSTEHRPLPTVFEEKIAKERKVSKHEKLSTIGKVFDLN